MNERVTLVRKTAQNRLLIVTSCSIVTPQTVLQNGSVVCKNGQIEEITDSDFSNLQSAVKVDGSGLYLVPGLIDLHCDMIEKAVRPRKRVFIDSKLAIRDMDVRMAAFGITTAYHGIRLCDELGLGSLEATTDLIRSIVSFEKGIIRHKVHLRVELTYSEGVQTAVDFIQQGNIKLVSTMDHTPGQGQYKSVEDYRTTLYRHSGYSVEEADRIIKTKFERARNRNQNLSRIVDAARKAGCVLASHDDETAKQIDNRAKSGFRISEFPLNRKTADYARASGLSVLVGAPNLLHGRSSRGNVSAQELVKDHVADIVCSDYHPPSLLLSILRAQDISDMSLSGAFALASLNPAKIVNPEGPAGIVEGAAADFVLMNLSGEFPVVKAVFIDGRLTFLRN